MPGLRSRVGFGKSCCNRAPCQDDTINDGIIARFCLQAAQDLLMQSLVGEAPEWQRGEDVLFMPECDGDMQDPCDNPYSKRLSTSSKRRRT